jgi:hypothetical protein
MPPAAAALNIGVGPCWGETCGDVIEATARIAPSQPNEAMARVAPRRKGTISLDPTKLPSQNSQESFFGRRLKIALEGPSRFKKGTGLGCSRKEVARHHQSVITTEYHNLTFSVGAISAEPPVVQRLLK